MRFPSLYIVPRATAESPSFNAAFKGASDGGTGWQWQSMFGGPPEMALFDIVWHPNASEVEAYLEALPGVIPLGLPWEPLPAAAVPILAAHIAGQAAYDAAYAASAIDGPTASAPVAALPLPQPSDLAMPQSTDSVARALNKMGRKIF